ncbi:MAG: GxxExxY protein [Fluviicola sp.]
MEDYYLLKEECYQLIGCCMEVHNCLGSGFSEIVYKDALEYELKRNHIPFAREVEYLVRYKDIILPHKFFADFVVFDSIILEAKAVSEITNNHYDQTLNYLVVSGMEVGLLVNFKQTKLQYKRIILTER